MKHHDDDKQQTPPQAEPDRQPQDEAPPQTPMEQVQAERDDLLARLQRVSADYLNYQKRAARDMQQAREFANESLIKSLLSVLDNMERALAAARANHEESDPLLTGMQLVHDSALDVLGKYGLKHIQAVGEPFNPELHSALMQQPSEEHEPMTVLQEIQKGYQLKGRTIRPAQVVVAKAPDETDNPERDD